MKKKKIALITGITGQDGAYLARLLLKKNYEVHGIKRRSSLINTSRIDEIYQSNFERSKKFYLHYGDVTDTANIFNLVAKIKPTEIYNLAAQSHVKVSFDTPIYTAHTNALGTINLLESIKSLNLSKTTKFYQASTSEMFGNSNKNIINEQTPFSPVSPYGSSKLFSYWIVRNYRDSYGIFASNGILFNHESPLRGETFVTKKITQNVAKRYSGKKEILYLGNLYAKRDWGHAQDYIVGMWNILNHKKPDDFILATNKTYTVKSFVILAFKEIGINIIWQGKGLNEKGFDKKTKELLVEIKKEYFRPNELHYLRGNPLKAKRLLKWSPKKTIKQLVSEMVAHDIKLFRK